MVWPELKDGEKEIPVDQNQVEGCMRNVHPSFMPGGSLSSQVFLLNSNDGGQLSTGRSSKVSAKDFFEEYLGLNPTCGVCSVQCHCIGDNDLRWIDDSGAIPPPQIRGHAYIDFRCVKSSRDQRKFAKALKKNAEMIYKP